MSQSSSDSPKDLTELVNSTRAKHFYQTCFVSSFSSEAEESDSMTSLPSTSSSSQVWTEEEIEILTENKRYFEEMVTIINKAEREGPQKLPKQPKRKLQKLFSEKLGKKKARKELSTPQELHDYLKANLADLDAAISRETFSESLFTSTTDETEIVKRLQKGVRNLKRQDAQTLMIYIQFGNFLNLCKTWQEQKKKEGSMTQTWTVWLKEKTGYSDDHARKLRSVASTLFGYPQFFRVSLPFSFISGKLNAIKEMLQVPELNEHWKQPFQLRPTLHLQHSQT